MAKDHGNGKPKTYRSKRAGTNENMSDSEDMQQGEDTISEKLPATSGSMKNNHKNQTSVVFRGQSETLHGTLFELRVLMLSCMNALKNCEKNRYFEPSNSNISDNSSTTNSNLKQQHLTSATATKGRLGGVREKYEEFYLMSGLIDAEAFDDVSFIYKSLRHGWQCILIQAKHPNKEKMIDLKELKKDDKDCYFGIRKYFSSYVKIKNKIENNTFASDWLNGERIGIDCVIICSNLRFAKGIVGEWFEEDDVNMLLSMGELYQTVYKFKHTKFKDVICELMGNSSEFKEDQKSKKDKKSKEDEKLKETLKEFLKCLRFAVAFPEIDIIDTVVSSEFNRQLSQPSMENNLAICFQGWLTRKIDKKFCCFTKIELEDFLTQCKSSFSELYLSGIMSEFEPDIKLYNIQTDNNSIFGSFTESDEQYIYCRTPSEETLRFTTVQVYSLLKYIVDKSKIFIIRQKVIEREGKYSMLSKNTYLIVEIEENTTEVAIKKLIEKTQAKTIVILPSSVSVDEPSKIQELPLLQYDDLPSLREKKIKLQENDILLENLIKHMSEEDKNRLFTPKILYQLSNPADMRLGTTLENTSEIYIERSIDHTCNLDIKKLLDDKNFFEFNLLVIENMTAMPGESFPSRENMTTYSSVIEKHNEQNIQETKFLILDKDNSRTWGSNYMYEDSAKELYQRFKRLYVHFVEVSINGSQYKLQCLLRYSSRVNGQRLSSSLDISSTIETRRVERLMLYDYIDNRNTVPMKENEFSLKKQITLLDANTGVGKSTFVKHKLSTLSINDANNRAPENSPFIWRIYVNLRNYKTYIDKHEFKAVKDIVEFLSTVESHNEDIKLITELFLDFFLNHSSERFQTMLVLDGYDEITESQQEKVLNMTVFITSKKHMSFVYILMTTRSYAVRSLQNKLGYYAYKLQNFSEENQQNYIKNLLLKENPSLSPETARDFSEKLVQKLKSSRTEESLLDTPLLCYIAAKIFAKDASFDDDRYLEDSTNVLNFYDQFIEYQYNMYRNKQGIEESIFDRWISDRANELHRYLSFYILFPNVFRKCYDNLDRMIKDSEDYAIVYGIGIVESVEVEGVTERCFTHQTFAEYYVAQFFLHILMQDREDTVFSACQLFLRDEIFKKANTSINFFLIEQLKREHDKTALGNWDFIQSHWLVKPSTQPSLLAVDNEDESNNEFTQLKNKCSQFIQKNEMRTVLEGLSKLLREYLSIYRYVIEKLKDECSKLVWTNVEQCKEVLRTIGVVYNSSKEDYLNTFIQSTLLECTNSMMAQLMHVPCNIRQQCVEKAIQCILESLQGTKPKRVESILSTNISGDIDDMIATVDYSYQLVSLLNIWLEVFRKIGGENINSSVDSYWSVEQVNQLKTKFHWLFSTAFPQLFMQLHYGEYRWRHNCILVNDYPYNERLVDLLINMEAADDKLKSLLNKLKELNADYFDWKYELSVVKLMPPNMVCFRMACSIMKGSEKNKEKLFQQLNYALEKVNLSGIESERNKLRAALIDDLVQRKLLDNEISDMMRKRNLHEKQFIENYFSTIVTCKPEEEFESFDKMLTDCSKKLKGAVESWLINYYQPQNFEYPQNRYRVKRLSEALLYGFTIIKKLRLFTMPMAHQLITCLRSSKLVSFLSDIDPIEDFLKPLLSSVSENHDDYIDRSALVYSLAGIYEFVFQRLSYISTTKHPKYTHVSKKQITTIVQLLQTVFKSSENYDFSTGSLSDTISLLLSFAKAHGFVLINDEANKRLTLSHPNGNCDEHFSTISEKFHGTILNHISEIRSETKIQTTETNYCPEQQEQTS